MKTEAIKTLVKRSQKGDAEAFGELYEMYSNDMYGFAYYYTSSEYFAREAVSDAVLIAFQNIRMLKKAESFKSWLFKILFNCCKNKQKEKIIMSKQKEISALDGFGNNEEEQNLRLDLEKALESLSEEERRIVILSFVCGYSSDEIGKVLDLKSSTVRSKQSRAVIKLRTFMFN